jgi:hypothetical protein
MGKYWLVDSWVQVLPFDEPRRKQLNTRELGNEVARSACLGEVDE